jgi:hypothetical protein
MSGDPLQLHFVHEKNPLHRVAAPLYRRLLRAQQNRVEKQFATAADLLGHVLEELKIGVPVPPALRGQPVGSLADVEFSRLVDLVGEVLRAAGIPGEALRLQAVAVAQRLYLVRAFEDPDAAVGRVTAKVAEIVGTFPRSAADIERGRNPGDVLDPYILEATRLLLHGGDFTRAVATTVGHKALMIIEGLLGHLHEDLLGEMRGNVRAPEPRGVHQEMLDLEVNPFPGADIVQPPYEAGGEIRFHQVKSKTGSAKGGDGARLGRQLRTLRDYYGGEIFYDALIGNTLRGHRSRVGVEREAPGVAVLVGSAAFRELTGSTVGPELLLRVYQAAFLKVAEELGYRVGVMTESIVGTFQQRAADHEGDFSEAILAAATAGTPEDQDSRRQGPRPGRRRL